MQWWQISLEKSTIAILKCIVMSVVKDNAVNVQEWYHCLKVGDLSNPTNYPANMFI